MCRNILIVLSILLLSVTILYAADDFDTLTFATYYPSPYGVYGEMKAKKMAVGDSYIDGGSYSWETGATNLIDSNADLVVEGNVGIGKVSPQAKLDVNGTVKATAIEAPGIIKQVQTVNPATDISTTSSSFVDMDGMSINLSTGTSKLLIFWNMGVRSTSAGWVTTEVQVDGMRVGSAQTGAASSNTERIGESISGNAVASVTAGSHTVKIRWKVSVGSAEIFPTSEPDFGRALTVIEVSG